ncbi:Uncharacterised protein [Mesomycoplasma dispar]|uniref:Uncharacterized protein n=1 Tax=Mesomycoplasma dispar TaxID=86660 RepID=A0AAJ5TCY7_9BACT|nr:hypothetical protein MDIS_02650 [Mesomycoplasma dispar]VEU62031.1 Uncharacterised protein [Mesomycoplasma dispar]
MNTPIISIEFFCNFVTKINHIEGQNFENVTIAFSYKSTNFIWNNLFIQIFKNKMLEKINKSQNQNHR